MSGGGGQNEEIGGGLMTAGLIAATVMSDGAAAPVLADELAAEGTAGAIAGSTGAATALGGDVIGTGATGYGLGAGSASSLGGFGAGIGGSGSTGLGLGASGFVGAGQGVSALDTAYGVGSGITSLGGGTLGSTVLGGADATSAGLTGGQLLQDANYVNTANNVLNPSTTSVPTSVAQTTPSYSTSGIDTMGQPIQDESQWGNVTPQQQAYNSSIPGSGNYQAPWYQNYWNQLTDTSGKGMNFAQKATLGGAGIATLLALQKSGAMTPKGITPYNPVTAQSMGLNAQMSPSYMPNRASQWGYAQGGTAVTSYTPQDVMPADLQNQQSATPAQLQQLMAQYGVTPQQATQGIQSLMGNQTTPKAGYSEGGETHLKEGSFIVPADVVSHFGNGSTDAGLHALSRHLGASPIRGSGDGMSDDIHTTIDGRQPARVADGEAMVSPERVKALGNGSTDAGAKKLYGMMDKIRKARTGSTKQGKQIKADKYLPT